MTDHVDGEERRHTAEIFRDSWLWLTLLGSVLAVRGLVQVMQPAKVPDWMGFIWHLTLGILATVGGALIYSPFAGVTALTLVIAGIFAIHGVTPIAFAVEVRGRMGWHWFLISGCIAFVVAVLLVLKSPYSHSFTPATGAGASLLFPPGGPTLPWRSRRAKPRPEEELCLASPRCAGRTKLKRPDRS